jgi:hypothetical protein
MAEFTHAQMHQDHHHWLNDSAMWRDDIEIWKEESQTALADLAHLEAALRQLIKSIQDRERRVNQHAQKIKTHEQSLSEFERSGQGDSLQLLTLAKAHQEEAGHHLQQCQSHERLKKDHHTIMAHWNVLLRELTRPLK